MLSWPQFLLASACFLLVACAGGARTVPISGQFSVQATGVEEALKPTSVVPTATVGLSHGHGCAVGSDRRVYCWGDNGDAALGDGTHISRPGPVRVLGVKGAIGVAVASRFNCALLQTGEVACWGYKPWGNFGSSADAELAPGGHRFLHIAAGSEYLCGIALDSRVRCLGDHGLLTKPDPLQARGLRKGWDTVVDVENATQILPLERGGCFLHADATVTCWKKSSLMGQGRLPQRVPGLRDAVRLDVSRRGLPCAVQNDGSGVCWSEQLLRPGDLLDHDPIRFPAVEQHETLEFIRAKGVACTRRMDGRIACAGDNYWGAVGAGKPSYASAPVLVPDFSVTRFTAMDEWRICGLNEDEEEVCARLRMGAPSFPPGSVASRCHGVSCHADQQDVVCTGENSHGELGAKPSHGTITVRHEKLGRVKKLVTSPEQSCALLEKGELRCWGTTKNLPFVGAEGRSWIGPSPLRDMPALLDVAIGPTGLCGLDEKGKVHCEGGRFSNLIAANAQRGVTALLARGDAGCFVTNERDVLCWGSGELRPNPKDEPYSQQKLPRELGLQRVSRLVAGRAHACSLSEDGQVHCWGDGRRGQVGAGSPAPNRKPTLVLENAVDIAAASDASCALDGEGRTLCWGGGMPGSAPESYEEPVEVDIP